MTKEILVLRHAQKDPQTKQLTPEGREMARKYGETLGSVTLAKASPSPRARETVLLITGKQPIIDERLGCFELPADQKHALEWEDHPFGVPGTLFEQPAYQPILTLCGQLLILAIQETLAALPDNTIALFGSHDIEMIAARQLLTHQHIDSVEKRFVYLTGFTVNERFAVEDR